MEHELKIKHGDMPEVAIGCANLGLLTKVTSRQVKQRGLSGGTLEVYLEVKPHLQEKEKHGVLLSVNNCVSTTLKMNAEQRWSLLPRQSARYLELQRQGCPRRSHVALYMFPCLWADTYRPQWGHNRWWLSSKPSSAQEVMPMSQGLEAHGGLEDGHFPSVLKALFSEQLGTEKMSRWFQIYEAATWPPRQSLWEQKWEAERDR